MPEIADAFGSPGVKRLAQTTCTGQYDPRTMGEIVEWTTSAALPVADLDEARAAAAQAEPYLTSHGWTIKHADHFDPEAPSTRSSPPTTPSPAWGCTRSTTTVAASPCSSSMAAAPASRPRRATR